MMNRLMVGALTFLIVAPAISICDEDLNKVNSLERSEISRATNNDESTSKQSQSFYYDDTTDDPWLFHRQLRAPSGFMGVRGKKDFEPENYEANDIFSSAPKRMPSQAFFGMRGKKFYDDKRAPSGFYGMRGKKDNDDAEIDEDLQAELYRELQQERLKIANLLSDYMSEKEKRKPSGFVGLRGKKSVNNDDYFEYEKRAPMGFQGVRGKKSEFSNFIGADDKRVPLAGFFGMRGKKQPFGYQSSSNFFGVRKKPYMPYGKFVGVRGKKDGASKSLRFDPDALDQSYGLRPAPRVASDTAQNKRFGFIGMRG